MRENGKFHIETIIGGLLVLFVFSILLNNIGVPVQIARSVFAILLLTLTPGALVLTLLDVPPRTEIRWLLYAAGVSLLVVILVPLLLSLVLPAIGILRPLSLTPLAAAFAVVIGGLCVLVRFTARDRSAIAVNSSLSVSPVPLAFLLLVPISALTLSFLNRTGNNLPLIILLTILAFIPFAAVVLHLSERWYPLAIWTVSLALLYHKTLWQHYYFRGHATSALVWRFQRWVPSSTPTEAGIWPSSSILPNALLYPVYAQLSGLDIVTQLQVINPIFVSFIPIVMYVTFNRYVSAREAFLGAIVLVFAHPFYIQFTVVGRAAPPVLFLLLLVMAVTDSVLSELNRAVLTLLFAAGNIVSHYGSAYFIMFTLVGTMLVMNLFPRINDILDRVPDVGVIRKYIQPRTQPEERSASPIDRLGSLTWSFVGFYIISTVTWYMYIDNGSHFDGLPERVAKAVADLLSGPSGGGTANRIARDYSSQSIRIAKYVYIITALLLAIGLIVTYLRQFLTSEEPLFSDEFLALTTAVFGAFSTSFVLAGSWGGGRPLMLVFAIGAVFAAVGMSAFTTAVAHLGRSSFGRVRSRYNFSPPWESIQITPSLIGTQLLAGILAVLLILNTGVAAAVALEGHAPSNVPLTGELEEAEDPDVFHVLYTVTDVQALVWYLEHGNVSQPSYADRLTSVERKQWYASEIARQAEPSALGATIRDERFSELEKPGIEEGYVVLQGHNIERDIDVFTGGNVWRPLNEKKIELPQRNKIYTTGNSTIYYYNSTTQTIRRQSRQ